MVGVKILYKLATSLAVHNMGFLKGECSKGGREGGREGGWVGYGGREKGCGESQSSIPICAITFCQWYLETHLSRHLIRQIE